MAWIMELESRERLLWQKSSKCGDAVACQLHFLWGKSLRGSCAIAKDRWAFLDYASVMRMWNLCEFEWADAIGCGGEDDMVRGERKEENSERDWVKKWAKL